MSMLISASASQIAELKTIKIKINNGSWVNYNINESSLYPLADGQKGVAIYGDYGFVYFVGVENLPYILAGNTFEIDMNGHASVLYPIGEDNMPVYDFPFGSQYIQVEVGTNSSTVLSHGYMNLPNDFLGVIFIIE